LQERWYDGQEFAHWHLCFFSAQVICQILVEDWSHESADQFDGLAIGCLVHWASAFWIQVVHWILVASWIRLVLNWCLKYSLLLIAGVQLPDCRIACMMVKIV
jgi:hypothetical protein